MRSRRRSLGHRGDRLGITSACAEQTTACESVSWFEGDHLRVCGADLGVAGDWSRAMGSPPRVRSRRTGEFERLRILGITSACAEQTRPCSRADRPCRDRLRVCGADLDAVDAVAGYEGSPPRVRSRRLASSLSSPCSGITSACAEQTGAPMTAKTTARDHLRVCGADGALAPASHGDAGSPPRVQSRQHRGATHPRPQRITSACAEQTSWPRWSWRCARDHLRVCGADFRGGWPVHLRGGSPPRVRSRPDYASLADQRPGITSACAEQTSTSTTPSFQVWDHLRVCGADHATPLGDGYYEGITSACAEQTTTPRCGSDAVWDHLRVCGADPMLARLTPLASGSPPRVRSRHPDDVPDVQQVGITSACAEQTQVDKGRKLVAEDHLRVCGADTVPDLTLRPRRGSPPRVRSRLPR